MAKPIGRLLLVGTCGVLVASLSYVGCGGSGTARPGTGGSTGTGGTSSTGGATGTGGSSSTGGTTGTGGAAGAMALSCTANPTTALLTNFGSAAGDGGVTAAGAWGTTGQLTGHTFGYKGSKTTEAGVLESSVAATIDRTNMDLELKGTIVAGDFAGGGMSFDNCVDSTNWTGIQFTLGGTTGGCILSFQMQTLSQEPPSNKGTCTASSCYNFPQEQIQITPGTPVTIKFADLANTGMPAAVADFEKEMFGLQWQFTSAPPPDGGLQMGCSPDMTITDVIWTSN